MNPHDIYERANQRYIEAFAEFGVGFQPPALTIAQVRAVLAVVAELEPQPSPVAQPTAPQSATPEAPKPKRPGRSAEHMARIRAAKMAKRLERQQQASASAPAPTAEARADEPEGES